MASHIGGYPKPSYSGGKKPTPGTTSGAQAGTTKAGGKDASNPGDQYTPNYSLDSTASTASPSSGQQLNPDKAFDNFALQSKGQDKSEEKTPSTETGPSTSRNPDNAFDNFALQAKDNGEETPSAETGQSTSQNIPQSTSPNGPGKPGDQSASKGNDGPPPEPNGFIKPRIPIPVWDSKPGSESDPTSLDQPASTGGNVNPSASSGPSPQPSGESRDAAAVPPQQNPPVQNSLPAPEPSVVSPAPTPQAPSSPVAQTPTVSAAPQVPVQEQVSAPPVEQTPTVPVAPQASVQEPPPVEQTSTVSQAPVQEQTPPPPVEQPVAPPVSTPQPQNSVEGLMQAINPNPALLPDGTVDDSQIGEGLVPSHVADSLISPDKVQALGNPFTSGGGAQQSAQAPGSSGGKSWTKDLYGGILDNYFGGQQPSSDGIRDTAGLQFTSGF